MLDELETLPQSRENCIWALISSKSNSWRRCATTDHSETIANEDVSEQCLALLKSDKVLTSHSHTLLHRTFTSTHSRHLSPSRTHNTHIHGTHLMSCLSTLSPRSHYPPTVHITSSQVTSSRTQDQLQSYRCSYRWRSHCSWNVQQAGAYEQGSLPGASANRRH